MTPVALTGDSGSPSTNGSYVLCAEVQTSFTEFRGQQNVHRLKLRRSRRSLDNF